MKLKRIEIHTFEGDLDLGRLNNAREKLDRAQKVIIYVPDYVFLATKWSIKNGNLNLSKVELRRASYDFFD